MMRFVAYAKMQSTQA